MHVVLGCYHNFAVSLTPPNTVTQKFNINENQMKQFLKEEYAELGLIS